MHTWFDAQLDQKILDGIYWLWAQEASCHTVQAELVIPILLSWTFFTFPHAYIMGTT